MVLLLGFAFLSGLVTILAPCIWPLLPIILSTSLNGSKAKSLGITFGIMASFAFFTLTLSYLVHLLGFDPNLLRIIAVIVLFVLGLSMVIPAFGRLLELWVSRFSGVFGQGNSQRKGFWGGLFTGLVLGIVWTPCAGPILAAIATLAATSKVNVGITLVTLIYVAGVGIPLFFFSYGGQKLITDTRFLSRYTGYVQQFFGVLLLLTALAVYTNYDKTIEANLLNLFPEYSSALTAFESNSHVTSELDKLKHTTSGLLGNTSGSDLPKLGAAPEFTGITNWLNSKPLTIKELRGKVVLVDFWTYTCINCIRTLPYTTGWYEKYKDQGFVVIGVHTPEFEIEKSTANVQNALVMYKIHYPVAQDNTYGTWNAYSNQYWPAEYLIDKDGNIRHTHFGEGEYDVTEKAIQALLKEKGSSESGSLLKLTDQTPSGMLTPETYVGTKRLENFGSNENVTGGEQTFTYQSPVPDNNFAYGGTWNVQDEYGEAKKDANLELHFYASKVFLVITPTSPKDVVAVSFDGKPIPLSIQGKDVQNGQILFDAPRLYELVNLHDVPGSHILRLDFKTQGTKIYAFTFG